MNRKIIRLEEIHERTGIPVATLRWYRHRGEGGPLTWKLGRRVVAYEDDVNQWLAAQRAASQEPLGAA